MSAEGDGGVYPDNEPHKKAVAKRAAQEPLAAAPLTPLQVLNNALERGADVDTLEKLMALQDKWERGQARKAFDEAIARAKAAIPIIKKNRTGHNDKKYADFAAVAEAVGPALAKEGLSYRFRTEQDDRNIVRLTCVLSHRDGHCEENTLAAPPDKTGNKNDIQAIGSTLTYLQRYALLGALGLAVGEDDDGQKAGMGEAVSDDEANAIRQKLDDTTVSADQLCEYLGVGSVPEIKKADFKRAMAAIDNAARNRRKRA